MPAYKCVVSYFQAARPTPRRRASITLLLFESVRADDVLTVGMDCNVWHDVKGIVFEERGIRKGKPRWIARSIERIGAGVTHDEIARAGSRELIKWQRLNKGGDLWINWRAMGMVLACVCVHESKGFWKEGRTRCLSGGTCSFSGCLVPWAKL